MPNNEYVNPASEPAEDLHALALQETAEQQGVMTPYMTRQAETGHGPHPWTDLPSSGKKPPRYSHRGGRSFPEEFEDPQTAKPPEVLTTEEKQRRAEVLAGPGHRAAMAAGVLAAHNSVMNKTSGEPLSYRLARERAAQEKRAREQRERA